MSTNDARRKVERLVNEHRPPHPAFFLSGEVHLQSFKPICPWGLDLFQAESAGRAGPDLQPWCLWYAALFSL